MTLLHPHITWTDEVGAAQLTCLGPHLQNWTPDLSDIGDSQVAVGSGRTYFYAYRTDHLATFEVANIANSELVLALRLKSWLVRGGTATITTYDSASHVYLVRLAPGTIPTLSFSDKLELEYTLALVVRNVDTPERPMPYTPILVPRVGGLSLSPSPKTISIGTDGTVTATVTDTGGLPVAGVTVTASSSDTSKMTVSPASGVSDGSGHVVFTLHPVAGGAASLVALAGAFSATDAITVAAGVYGILSPDPILWLKRDSLTAQADGSNVSLWPDSAPHHWDMSPMVSNGGGVAPKWDAAEGGVHFTAASGQALESTGFNDFASITGFTLFVVSKEASNGGCVMSSSGGDYWEGYTSAGRYRTDISGFGYGGYFTFGDLLRHIHETRYDGTQGTNAAKLVMALDGTVESPSYYMVPSSLSSSGGMCVGHGTGLTFFNGWLYEVLLFPGRLSDADCDTVRGALAAKYP